MKLKISIIISAIGIVGILAYLVLHTSDTNTKKNPGIQTKKVETTPIVTPPVSKSFDKTLYSSNDPASIWVVVNKLRPLAPVSYAPTDLITVGSGQVMRSEAGRDFIALASDAAKESLIIQPLSGYRSYTTQVSVYANEVKTNGKAVADSESARPGYSEHQTGLALDVGGGGCGIEDCFGSTKEAAWLVANAYKYGFILRYTPDKVAITGYRSEPWHYRYVGKELAQEMHTTNTLTLEEFFSLPPAPQYEP